MCLILATTFKCKHFFTVTTLLCNSSNYKAAPCNKTPENVYSNFDFRGCAGDGDGEASSDEGNKLRRGRRGSRVWRCGSSGEGMIQDSNP